MQQIKKVSPYQKKKKKEKKKKTTNKNPQLHYLLKREFVELWHESQISESKYFYWMDKIIRLESVVEVRFMLE